MDLKQEVSILHSRNTTQLRSDRAKEELLERLIRDPLLSADPLLRHALADQGRQGAVTHKSWAARVELLDALIAQEAGEAFNIYVLRHDGERIPLVVSYTTTLDEVKRQLQLVVEHRTAEQRCSGSTRHISWKQVWNRQCLMYDGRRLLDGKQQLSDAGIGPDASLAFADYRPPDPRGRHNY